jgi:hypothetical protein
MRGLRVGNCIVTAACSSTWYRHVSTPCACNSRSRSASMVFFELRSGGWISARSGLRHAAEPCPRLVGAGGELFEFDEINKQAMHYVTKGAYVSKWIMEEWYRRPSAERQREYQVTVDITPESSTPLVLEQEGLFYRLDQLSYQVYAKVRTSPLSMSAMSFNQRRVLQGNTRLEGPHCRASAHRGHTWRCESNAQSWPIATARISNDSHRESVQDGRDLTSR